MKMILFFVLLISLSSEQFIKRSQRSKHGEDCISDSACEEGLICKINRCFTRYEAANLKQLGLFESNLCSYQKKCPANKICIKHRCVPSDAQVEPRMQRTGNFEDVHLLFTGKILLNNKPYLSGIRPDNTINYDHLFTHILTYIKSSDLAVAPMITPFYTNEGLKLKKDFKNTPKELGDAIANAGFKVVLHATAEIYSHKEKGILDTLNFWKTKYPDVHPLGIAATAEEREKDYYIFEKNGIKIAIINYSGFVGKNIPKKNSFMVNVINRQKVESLVQKLKQETDFIIVCINWGEKFSLTPNKNQILWAKILAGMGVNLIIGNNPSFVQPVSLVKAQNGNTALVFFSLGALVGENSKKLDALGALANIVISKENGKTSIASYNLIPTINHVAQTSDYTVYKLSEYNDYLGKSVNKKFSKDKVVKSCKASMGAFAHCF